MIHENVTIIVIILSYNNNDDANDNNNNNHWVPAVCQLWALCFREIILFDTYSKLYKVHFIIPFIEEETKDHKI